MIDLHFLNAAGYPGSVSAVFVNPLPLFVLTVGLVVSAGCSHTGSLDGNASSPESGREPDYSVVFYIHGDGDYLYHTGDGAPADAGRTAMDKAKKAAENGRSGEFFVFYHQPEKRWMWLIPRQNSELFHFRNGRLVNHLKYRYKKEQIPFLQPEADLYRQWSGLKPKENRPRYFFYFGHEIPVTDQNGYHNSQPGIVVGTPALAAGLLSFLGEASSSRFDLVALSTCNNGTPEMASLLRPIADYLLASPWNLHLSHLDTGQLAQLEAEGASTYEVSRALAEETFRRLSGSLQTAVTLALYDLEKTAGYIDRLAGLHREYRKQNNPDLHRENRDCAALPFFDAGKQEFTEGVEVWYKPARFGERASVRVHSGWGCK